MSDGETTLSDAAFDDVAPWGRYRMTGIAGALLKLCHGIPPVPGGRRLAMWLRHPLKHRLRRPVDVEAWGYRLRLMPRGNLSESRWLFVPQFIDRAERRFFAERLNGQAVFVDVGANAGLYSFWAARCSGPGGRVLAVEPDPELQRRIRFNLQTNRVANLHLVPAALSDKPGSMRLKIGAGNRGENALEPGCSSSGSSGDGGVAVVVKTLPQLCAEVGIEHITALKIDIEGHEHAVMRHFFDCAPRALWPRYMQFETCTQDQTRSMQRLSDEFGYTLACRGRMNTIVQRGD